MINRKNVKKIKEINNFVFNTLCESCMKSKQQITSSRRSMKKATKFLKKIYVNIKGLLFITFKNNKYFLLIKNKTFEMFFVYVMRIKNEILLHLQQFRI